MQKIAFVHLQTHSDYSLLSALPSVSELVARAAELKMPALALTDLGNLFGAVEFYDKAIKHGIKPILGCEFFVCEDRRRKEGGGVRAPAWPRLVLLAKSNPGWKSLMRLSSLAYLEGFYYKPRIDWELLAEHGEGLIAIDHAWHGHIAQLLRARRSADAEAVARRLMEIFPGRFFVAVQRARHPGELEDAILALTKKLSIPIVATNDVYMLDPADYPAFETLISIQQGGRTEDEFIHVGPENALKPMEAMAELFRDLPDALQNSVHIAMQCNVELDFGRYELPDFRPPEGHTLEDHLRNEAYRGLETRWEAIRRTNPKAERAPYEARLDEELAIITKMGFAGYFLIVADFIRWAKRRGIPVGPGRGSGAGSLVAYCLGITNLDPIRYGLLFERFLNPERVSMPDFDIDFCMNRRDEVIEYVARKYGRDHVAQIITFGQMKAKAVVRDVGRALKLPLELVDRLAKLIPNDLGITLARALEEEPRLVEAIEKDERVRQLFEMARKLEGRKRNAGKHAAGVIIGRRPLIEVAPLYRAPGEDEVVVQWDMKQAEMMGLVKFDFLGLKTLTVIDLASRFMRERGRPEFSIESIPLDDPKTFELYQQARTAGVFQVESAGMRELLLRMRPDCFEDLIALVALYRPGPLESGMVDAYVRRKHGQEPVSYPHPKLAPILKETYGVIVYQEQVMQIAQTLAGYTLGQADLLRRAMGKKKPEEMQKQKAVFIEGAVQRGIDAKKAEEIFDLMEKFAGYGFNKSHSAAYALVSYQTAYLKAHDPVAFIAATMSCELGSTEKIAELVAEARSFGIRVLAPDLNRSRSIFTPEGDAIRYGLAAIKGVGEAAAEAIEAEREKGGPYRGLVDLLARTPEGVVNRRVAEALIKAGALDALVPSRAAALAVLDEAIERAQFARRMRGVRQGSLFAGEALGDASDPQYPALHDTPSDRLKAELEALGFYLTDHPLRALLAQVEGLASADLAQAKKAEHGAVVALPLWVVAVRRRRASSGEAMAFLTVEDLSERMDLICFPDLFARTEAFLQPERAIFVQARVDRSRSEQAQLIAEEVLPLETALAERAAEIVVTSDAFVWTQEAAHAVRKAITPGKARLVFRLRLPNGSIAVLRAGIQAQWNEALRRALFAHVPADQVRVRCARVGTQGG